MNDNVMTEPYFRLSHYQDKSGKTNKKYNMSRDGFSLLAMGFTGKKALDWKIKYNQAFNLMEKTLLQKQDQEWQLTRTKGIEVRKGLGNILKQFVEYSKKQGSTKATFYFSNVTRETYKALKLIEGREKIPEDFRTLLNSFDLASLTMAEYVAQGALMEGMVKQMFYKEIYQFAKEKVLIFASSIAVAKITSDFKSNKLTHGV